MEEKKEVKLHGIWASTYVKIVEVALRAKGIPSEYIEKDLSNKSQLLLRYNPVHKKLFEAIGRVITGNGVAQEKNTNELAQQMDVFEEEVKKNFPEGSEGIQNENIGLLDILLSATFSPYKAQEEIAGVKILDPERHPFIYSWVTNLNQVPVMKELVPLRRSFWHFFNLLDKMPSNFPLCTPLDKISMLQI
ncbi:hypothetical protein CRYUN_Cryun12cG0150100 [Craigia yunnanensis]